MMPSGPVGSAGALRDPEHCPAGHIPSTYVRLQECRVSYIPRQHFERCKLLAVLTREGQRMGPCGSHPLLTRNHWPPWKWSQAILDGLSTADIWIVSCSTTLSPAHARLWRQTDNQPEPASACSDPNRTPRKKVSRTLLAGMHSGTSFWKVRTPLMLA